MTAAGRTPRRLVVVSGRRFVAESLVGAFAGILDEAADTAAVVNGDGLGLASIDPRPSIWFVDLDVIGLTVSELSDAMRSSTPIRRAAFYDSFTADKAETAFDLGITALCALTSTVDHLRATLFGDARASTVTTAEGLNRSQLRRLSSLSGREVDVLAQLASGRPVKAAAVALGITSHTVSSHKRRIFDKLGVRAEAEAVAIAMKAGLIEDDRRPG